MDNRLIAGAVIALVLIAVIYNTYFSGASVPITLQEGYNVKGAPNAPVVIEEFSDFECPACGYFYANSLKQVEDAYVSTGKAKIIYRQFPLPMHKDSEKAAEAALCAAEQGKFWEMHNWMFENQDSLSVASLKSHAPSLGLDSIAFNQCLDSGKMRTIVENDITEGKARGISATPSFFINGQKLVGAQPFEVFQQAIDAELAK